MYIQFCKAHLPIHCSKMHPFFEHPYISDSIYPYKKQLDYIRDGEN